MPPRSQPVCFRIELREVKPLVWRRVVVPHQWTLASLHSYLQWVVGWQDSHAHEFHVGSRVVAPDWWIREMEFDRGTAYCADERRVSVAAVANELGVGGMFEYHYDMGDGWEHRIVIEEAPATWIDHGFNMPSIPEASISTASIETGAGRSVRGPKKGWTTLPRLRIKSGNKVKGLTPMAAISRLHLLAANPAYAEAYATRMK